MSETLDDKCLATVYELHSQSTNKIYFELRDRVIDDVLMNKIRDGKLSGITAFVQETIQYFYTCANELYEKIHFDKGCNYTVHRGTKQTYLIKDNKVIQPIPFSTSLEERNIENWVGSQCCKWHINFPLNTRFVGIDNPNEGKEIVLPAGILHLTKQWIDIDNIINYNCILEPTKSYNDMLELQKKYNF